MSSSNETISREGGTPVLLAYVTNYCIVDEASNPKITKADYPEILRDLAPKISGLPGPQDVVIPSWQRKLVWDKEKIDSLVHSESSMFGTAILSKGERQSDSWKLIDGLQRFSAGTSLIHALYDEVLSSTPNRPTEAKYFVAIKDALGKKYAVIEWNHKRLSSLGKRGIRTSYNRLYAEVKEYVIEELNNDPKEFAESLTRSFLIRQVAVDPYSGFQDDLELIRTFFSINSTGEVLSKTDLLRAKILLQLEQKEIEPSVMDELENNFTETFQQEKGSKYFADLGVQMYNIMFAEKEGHDPYYVFPNWDKLSRDDLDEMFEYHLRVAELPTIIEKINTQPNYKWPFLAEIFPFKLPYIMLTMYYFKNHYQKFLKTKKEYVENKKLFFQSELMGINITELRTKLASGTIIDMTASEIKAKELINEIINNHQIVNDLKNELIDLSTAGKSDPSLIKDIESKISKIEKIESEYPELLVELPDFLGGKLDTQQDLKKFYRAVVRKFLDGNIGKTEKILHMVMRGTLDSMDKLSEKLSPEASGCLDEINKGWLKSVILKSKKPQAKIIFNVCLLPERNDPSKRIDFKPLIYKNATNYYNIDHLIPDSLKKEELRGLTELQTIVNFAPLESEKNKAASSTPCSLKLSTSTIYDQISQIHPYCEWLTNEHFKSNMEKQVEYNTGNLLPTPKPGEPPVGISILDSQLNLIEGDESKLAMARVETLIKILSSKL